MWRQLTQVVSGIRRCAGCSDGSGRPCRSCDRELAQAPAAVGAVWADRGVAARLVRAGKFRCLGWVPGALAQVAARRLGSQAARAGIRYVAWVPAHPWRGPWRGCCLPRAFARELAAVLDLEPVGALVNHGAPRQRGRDRGARIARGIGGFAPAMRAPSPGTPILLVDDVRTTGSTLAAAGAVLETAGWQPFPLACTAVPRR